MINIDIDRHYLDELRPVLRWLALGCLGGCVALVALATIGVKLPAHQELLLMSLSVGWHALLGLIVTRARGGLGAWGADAGLYVTLAGLYGSAVAVLLSLFVIWLGWVPGAFWGRIWLISNNVAMSCAGLSLLHTGACDTRWEPLRLWATLAVLSQLALTGLLALFMPASPWLWQLNAVLAVLALGGVAATRLVNGPLPPDPPADTSLPASSPANTSPPSQDPPPPDDSTPAA